jgi:MoxR-like ATPase
MLARVGMSGEGAVRRVKQLGAVLGQGRAGGWLNVGLRYTSTSSQGEQGEGGKVINIGDISMTITRPKNPEYVPNKYIPEQFPQTKLRHLRWIMQKDLLGQDVFLIGPPGPLRRSLAMMYLELTQKEAEYVSLSRDTTETDLKQRREILAGTAYHIDQCAVKAATHGRVLILEGIEKAERNVLPVLNNLLENREMQLDDGRFLMAAARYDKLLEEHKQEELDAWKLVRVSEDFRVIALGLPVPRYQGNPLDPPLRSRFQARDINPLPFKDQLEVLNSLAEGVSPDRLSQVLSFANTMRSSEANTLGLQDFPLDNLPTLIKILGKVQSISPLKVLKTLYPYDIMMNKEGRASVEDALKSFELFENSPPGGSVVNEVRRHSEGATVQLHTNHRNYNIEVAQGTVGQPPSQDNFIATPYHDDLLSDMMLSHSVMDFCLIGPRGCGKTVLVKQFADLLGYHIEPIMLYQDMTARDLLQQRMTLPNGDTSWRPSPLVTAAMEGSLAVLDGVHRANNGTFAVLHRLIHDRELTLFDGTRLLKRERYDVIKAESSLSDAQMKERGILAIHPSFRVLALSEPPVLGSSSQQWLNSELLTMFLYHNMRPMTQEEEQQVLKRLVPNMTDMRPIMTLTHKLRQATDSNLKSVAASLSTRQLLRIAKRLADYPTENLHSVIEKACLSRFLPRLARTALEEELEELDIPKAEPLTSVDSMDKAITCSITGDMLRIGNTQVPLYNPENRMKVPDVLFYENPQHLAIMEDMLKDYLLGEHLLLVGNQGVGKNKIVDRFLYLLNRPREYLQLHRDTTVQTLTLQPTVQAGIIKYEDSPLVRAVKSGHILVIDEADKAPTNVTCILKTLVESGEMHLADGRRVVNAHSGIPPSSNIIVAHPDFRMIVLANRPGFPFLGNDFFGAMGDIFSCHAVDNPDMESEMSMLRQYGPDVPETILRKLVLAFGDLRSMADQGLINYPYSTREVVNMVKHLQMFPEEGLANVVRNVFDFDTYNKEMTETIVQTLHKHGIPVVADPSAVNLAQE